MLRFLLATVIVLLPLGSLPAKADAQFEDFIE
jgi:hypothetical protein